MLRLIYCAAGGAIGAVLRYLISGWTYRFVEGNFPLGTLFVNSLGSIAIGFLWGIFETVPVSPNTKIFVLMGIIGAFTTFSTFALENFNLFRDGETGLAALNIILSNGIGIALVFISYFIAKFMLDVLR